MTIALSVQKPAASASWRLLDKAPIVLSLLAVWLLCTAWLRPLLLPDEARYAEVAREMLAGDHLLPLLNGMPFFHKPPLTYWVDILGMRLLGVTPFAARLGPLLGAWMMGSALWLELRHRAGAQQAGLALLVLATSPFFFIGGQYANHDMLVAGNISVALLCWLHALDRHEQALYWWVAGWCACALAVLSKGLIGIVIPLAVFAPWLLAQRRWRDARRLFHPLGLASFALIALPWFVLMQSRYPSFFDYFVLEQHVRRYATSGFNNLQPWWFLLGVLPLLTLPWSAGLLLHAKRIWRRQNSAKSRQWTSLMLWWLLVVMVFFSIPASKLAGYIMPALLPWCALISGAIPTGRARNWLLALASALCLGSIVCLAWQAPKSNRDIALELRQQLRFNDLVVFIDDSFNDVAFEARLDEPPTVASAWQDAALLAHDGWRKELADTSRFDANSASRLMIPTSELTGLVCRGRRVWLVESNGDGLSAQSVPGAARVMLGKHASLWLANPRDCAADGKNPLSTEAR